MGFDAQPAVWLEHNASRADHLRADELLQSERYLAAARERIAWWQQSGLMRALVGSR